MSLAKYLFVLILFFTSIQNAFCQLATFQDEDAMITPNFKGDIIRTKQISQITIHYFSKPDEAPITDERIIYQYLFDTTGKLIESFYMTKTGRKTWDTIKCIYGYDTNSNLTIKRTQTGDFYDTWYYKWNRGTMVQNECHAQEISDTNIHGAFKTGTQRIISKDSLAYIVYPKQTQQYAFNDDHKIFRKTITQYDDNRRFVSRNCQYAVGSLYSQVDVKYDSLGRIKNYTNTGNLNGDTQKKTSIKYDSAWNIAEQDIWEDGKQTHHIEYMYDNATGLISYKLDKDIDKSIIYILRFSYEMRDSRN